MSTLVEKVMKHHMPKNWTPMAPDSEFLLVDVDEGTEEYENVCGRFRSEDVPRVRKLQRIQNPYLWNCYLCKKKEYELEKRDANEMTVYHETAEEYAESIIADNFNWRSYRRTMFGKGVSFSALPEYAHDKSTHKGVMFVVRLLCGKCEQSKELDVPSEGFDTTTSGEFNYKVIVGFNDSDYYPEYIVYWEKEEKRNGGDSISMAG